MDAAALLVSILAVVLTVLAFYVQRRDRGTDRAEAADAAREAGQRADRAQGTADEANAAARRSAESAERMAQALEAQALAAAQAAPTPQAAWRLEHSEGDKFVLTNTGDGAAHDVHIDLGDIGPVMGNGLDEQVVQPGSAMQFLAALTLATRDDTVTVTWASTPGGERRTWKRPLPPKPRKGGAVWGA